MDGRSHGGYLPALGGYSQSEGNTGLGRLAGRNCWPLTTNNHLRQVRLIAFVLDGFSDSQAQGLLIGIL